MLRPVHPRLGYALLHLEDTSLYDEATGLRLGEPPERSPESNVI